MAAWMLAVVPILAALFYHAERRRRVALDRLLAARLQPRLAGSVSTAKRRWGFALFVFGIALATLALARPQWGFTWQERKQRGRDILIALDTSRSMLATDLQPNRLERAKLAAQDLLGLLEGDRVGLIAFAGSSFLQAPLTADFTAVREALQEIDTEIIPRGGTNLAEAIKAASDALGNGESDSRALIIFTDGEELEEDAVAVARANKEKFRIFTVGLGSAEGALIPVRNEAGGTEFIRDDRGQYVKSRLDERRLREVAEASGGFYVPLQQGPAEMNQIVRDGLEKMKETETDARFSKEPVERYQWPLAASMACLAAALLLGERRRVAVVARVAALIMGLSALPAQAKHAGIEKFEQKDFGGSLGEFDRELARRELPELQFDAGNAAFELGDYDRAATAFGRALGTANGELKARAAYNLANTLARRGIKQEKKEDKLSDLRDAVRVYGDLLKSEPGHADASHNRDLVGKIIEQLEKEEKQKQEQEKQDKKDEKKDDKDQKDQEKQDSSQGGKDDEKKQDQQDGGKQDKEEKKDSSQGGKDDQQKQDSQQGKGDDKKQGESGQKVPKEQENGKPESQPQTGDEKKDDKNGRQPKPEPGEPDKQKTGELKAASPGQEDPQKQNDAAEAAEAAAAAREGRMTEKDAKQMFEALRKLDRRVRLLNPADDKSQNRNLPFKNW
jgi:Ca-activated chloride channel family protein